MLYFNFINKLFEKIIGGPVLYPLTPSPLIPECISETSPRSISLLIKKIKTEFFSSVWSSIVFCLLKFYPRVIFSVEIQNAARFRKLGSTCNSKPLKKLRVLIGTLSLVSFPYFFSRKRNSSKWLEWYLNWSHISFSYSDTNVCYTFDHNFKNK